MGPGVALAGGVAEEAMVAGALALEGDDAGVEGLASWPPEPPPPEAGDAPDAADVPGPHSGASAA
ncbi:MAG: hypothetical protein VKO26_03465 [Cyanobacteriota bacterium]|nr:hypothetical protein [Cyanobacteriota bacterium]